MYKTHTYYLLLKKKMKTTSITIPPHSVNTTRPFLFVYDCEDDQYVNFTVEPNQQEGAYHHVHGDHELKLYTIHALRTYQVRMFESADTSGEYDVLEDTEMACKQGRYETEEEQQLFSSPFGEMHLDSFETTFMSTLNHEQCENEVKNLKQENKWLTCMVQTLQAEMREKNEIQQNILKTCAQLTKEMEEIKKQCFDQKKSD